MLSWPGRPHTASPNRAGPRLCAYGNAAAAHRSQASRPGAKSRGQALVEFALILPILLTLFGATVDVARVYSTWNVLESATRDAAEYAATKSTTKTTAAADASRVVCAGTAGLAGYQAQAGPPACSSPTVEISAFSLSESAPGATKTNPIASVTVVTTLKFTTFFPYPLLTQGGAWTLQSTQSFSIVQGR